MADTTDIKRTGKIDALGKARRKEAQLRRRSLDRHRKITELGGPSFLQDVKAMPTEKREQLNALEQSRSKLNANQTSLAAKKHKLEYQAEVAARGTDYQPPTFQGRVESPTEAFMTEAERHPWEISNTVERSGFSQERRPQSVRDIVKAGAESLALTRRLYADKPVSQGRPSRQATEADRPDYTSELRALGQDDRRLSANGRAALARFRRTLVVHTRSQKHREQELATIKKGIRRTAFLVVVFVLFVAGVADILSLVDLGWLVSWLIPIFSWFMVKRINGMMKSSNRIVDATNRLGSEAEVLRNRVLPLLPAHQRAQLRAQAKIGRLTAGASSYVSTWVRDTIIVQLLELIPIIDILPMYLGQVVKMIVNQNIEYQKVQKIMPAYERALASVTKLERIELEQLALRLRKYAALRQSLGRAPLRDADSRPPQTPPRQAPVQRSQFAPAPA